MLNRWIKRLVSSRWKNELREYLSTRAFRLPDSQIQELAKRFKTKPQLIEMLNEEIAIRLADAVIDFVEKKL